MASPTAYRLLTTDYWFLCVYDLGLIIYMSPTAILRLRGLRASVVEQR